MRSYIKAAIWDLAICAVCGCALAYNLFAGFEMASPASIGVAAPFCVALAVNAACFASAYNKRTLIVGLCAFVMAALLSALLVRMDWSAASGGAGIGRGTLVFWFISTGAPVFAFLLSRSRAGSTLLFLAGGTLFAAFDFLGYPVSLLASIVFLFCSANLFLFRVYAVSLRRSVSGSVKRRRYFAQSAAAIALSLLLSCGAYYFIVRPNPPPTEELKLITTLLSLEVLEKLGVSSKTEIETDQEMSDSLNEQVRTTLPEDLPPEEPEWEDQREPEQPPSPDVDFELAAAISYASNSWMLTVVIVIAALIVIVSPVAIKLALRNRWYARLLVSPPETQFLRLYMFFANGLYKAGFRRSTDVTLLEYAKGAHKDLEEFSVGDSSFLGLTETYARVLYGCHTVNREDVCRAEQFYAGFYKNLRRSMGVRRYLLRFMTI